MIDEKILLQELDEMIKIQQKSVERAEQGSNEAVVYLESRELAAYMKVRNLIKEKSAHKAATPLGTQIKVQKKLYHRLRKETNIKDKFLAKCDNAVIKSCRFVEVGDEDKAFKVLEDMAEEAVTEVLGYVNPISEHTLVFIVPVLRTVSDALEKGLTDYDRGISEYIESFLGRSVKSEITKEEKDNGKNDLDHTK